MRVEIKKHPPGADAPDTSATQNDPVEAPDAIHVAEVELALRAPFKTFDTKLVGISTNMQGL